MSNLGGWPSDSVILALGWTLIHFLWQGALVGVLFASTRVLLRGVGPRVRYALACLALALMVVLPATSFLLKVSPSQPVGEQSVLSPERTQARTSPLATRINAATPGPQSSLSSRDRGTGLLDHSLPWIVLFWTMGVATLSIRMAGGWLYARRLKWEGTEEASPELKVTFRNLVKRVEVSRPVRFLLSTRVEVPMVIGWLRPFVIVPCLRWLDFPLSNWRPYWSMSWHTSDAMTTLSIFFRRSSKPSFSTTQRCGGSPARSAPNARTAVMTGR